MCHISIFFSLFMLTKPKSTSGCTLSHDFVSVLGCSLQLEKLKTQNLKKTIHCQEATFAFVSKRTVLHMIRSDFLWVLSFVSEQKTGPPVFCSLTKLKTELARIRAITASFSLGKKKARQNLNASVRIILSVESVAKYLLCFELFEL